MAKKVLTPEQQEIKAMKKVKKSQNWTKFWAIVLALVLTCGIAFAGKTMGEKNKPEAVQSGASENGGSSSSDNSDDNSYDPGSNNNNTGDENNGGDPANNENNNDNNGGNTANTNNGGSANNGGTAAATDAAAAAKAINDATAKASKGSYKFHRNCVIQKIDVGNATDTLNGIIKKVAPDEDLNSVVGNFLDKGELNMSYPAEKDNYKEKFYMKATQLKAEDLQNLKVDGNKYTFTLKVATDPKKDNSTALSRLTNDFITHEEVATGVKDALGKLSFLLSVKSSTVVFKDIKVTAVIDNGNLKSLSYSYYMDVQKLELSVVTGTGYGTVEGTYTVA